MVKRKHGAHRPPKTAGQRQPADRTANRSADRAAHRSADRATGRPTPNLVYGHHAAAAALGNPQRPVLSILCVEEAAAGLTALLDGLPADRRQALPAPSVVAVDDLDTLAGESAVHQGIALRVGPLPEIALEDVLDATGGQSILVVLDQVTDPHNIGAILRSAAAFGADALIVPDRHTPQATATVAKTASGAMDVVPMVRVTNLARALRTLQESGFWCIGLAEQGEQALDAVALDGRIALVLGAEGDGLRRLTRETCDLLVHLPTRPPIRSLNVSAAAAIALHQAAVAPARRRE